MILFFDTETTGKADFNAKLDAPHQPRIVQKAHDALADVRACAKSYFWLQAKQNEPKPETQAG